MYLHIHFQIILRVVRIIPLVTNTNKACTYTSLEKGLKAAQAQRDNKWGAPQSYCGTLIPFTEDKAATTQCLLEKFKFTHSFIFTIWFLMAPKLVSLDHWLRKLPAQKSLSADSDECESCSAVLIALLNGYFQDGLLHSHSSRVLGLILKPG